MAHSQNIMYALMGTLGVIPASKNVFIITAYDYLNDDEKDFYEWAVTLPGLHDSVTLDPQTWKDIFEEFE